MLKIIKILLLPLAYLYQSIVKIRNFLYNKNILKINHLPVPVISIGNITAGGTGKTPFAIALANILQKKGYNPAIITRGYKKNSKGQVLVSKGKDPLVSAREAGDEPYLMAQKTRAVVIANPNRYEAGNTAIQKYHCDLIIADDGFQHRKLARDFDLVLWDPDHDPHKAQPLPSGYLREPLSAIKRASALVYTRTDQIPENQANYLKKIKSDLPHYFAQLKISCLYRANDKTKISSKAIEGKSLVAFCGLGNPEQFFATVQNFQPKKLKTRGFSDHHKYSQQELKKLIKEFKEYDFLITTEKDLSNFPKNAQIPENILILAVELEVPNSIVDQILKAINYSDFISNPSK
ncbi:MAG TPA: tetraacyldisaccharide 4'-kinase [bacterium]|nr:tetraacyldisaccharide 4'-kinase [bacterium]